MLDMERRISALERTNRRLRVGLAVLSSLMCMAFLGAAGDQDARFRDLIVRRLVVGEIADGRPIVTIDGSNPHIASISLQRLTGGEAKTFMNLQIGKAPLITVQDPDSASAVLISATRSVAGISASSPNGKQDYKMQVDNSGLRGERGE